MSPGIPHSSLQGQALGLVNQPILLQTLNYSEWLVGDCPGYNRMPDKGEGSRASTVNPSTPQPIRFDHLGDCPQKDTPRDANSDHQLSSCWPLRGQNCNQHRRDQGLPPPQSPSPSLDCGFESERSSVSMASSMSSPSDRSEGSQHPW